MGKVYKLSVKSCDCCPLKYGCMARDKFMHYFEKESDFPDDCPLDEE